MGETNTTSNKEQRAERLDVKNMINEVILFYYIFLLYYMWEV